MKLCDIEGEVYCGRANEQTCQNQEKMGCWCQQNWAGNLRQAVKNLANGCWLKVFDTWCFLHASAALTNLTQHRLGHRAVAAGSGHRLQHACRIGRSFSSKSGLLRGDCQPTLATSVRARHQLALFITAWVAAWQLPAHAGGPCARETTSTYAPQSGPPYSDR